MRIKFISCVELMEAGYTKIREGFGHAIFVGLQERVLAKSRSEPQDTGGSKWVVKSGVHSPVEVDSLSHYLQGF